VSRTATHDITPLRELRRRRQRNRLADLEWFEAAYRVYLVALFGGGGVLWVSSIVGDGPVGAATESDIARHGPAVLGLLVVIALLVGARSGAQGGPLAVEEADVTHVLLSPISRRAALARPAWQRIRSVAVLSAWAGSGALFGLTIALAWVGAALAAHAARLPLFAATAGGVVLLAWQTASAMADVPGPADRAGSLAMWGWRQHPLDLFALPLVALLTIAGFAGVGRTRVEALARRASLVAQLRFAVTTQDLRTVILLRRQLNQEQVRRRPWARPPRFARGAIAQRGWQGVLRFPATRLARIAALGAGVGVTQAMVVRGTTSALAICAALCFLIGLEVTEPLAQEVDHPTRTDALPVERGDLFLRHLAVPAMALVPVAAVTAGASAMLLDGVLIGAMALLALPTLLAGACGGVVSTVRDAHDPMSTAKEAFMPPEVAGVVTTTRLLLPLVISGLGAAPALLIRSATTASGASPIAAAVRAAGGALLVAGATALWVHRRDRWRRTLNAFMAEGRAQATAR
jgi:hypothetical protein